VRVNRGNAAEKIVERSPAFDGVLYAICDATNRRPSHLGFHHRLRTFLTLVRPMRYPIFQVDAFATRLFTGSPAAVVSMKSFPPDAPVLDTSAGEAQATWLAGALRPSRTYV
jgi:hypothetical protein